MPDSRYSMNVILIQEKRQEGKKKEWERRRKGKRKGEKKEVFPF